MQKKNGQSGGILYRNNMRRITAALVVAVCVLFLMPGCFFHPGSVQENGYTALDTVLHSAVPGAIVWKDSKFEFATSIATDAYGRNLYSVRYTSFFGDRTVAYIVTQIETKTAVSYDSRCCYLLKTPSSSDATKEDIVQLCVENGWNTPIDKAVLTTTLFEETDYPLMEGERIYNLHDRVNADVAQELGLASSLSCIADGLQLFNADGRQVIAIRIDKDEWATATQDFTCYFALYSPIETPKVSNLVEWIDPENSKNELIKFCQNCGIELPVK